MDATQPKKSYTIWWLTLAFIAPLLLAMAFFQWTIHFGVAGTANYGTLITPIRPVQINHKQRNILAGKWSYVYLADSCDERCAQWLKHAETVRILTNEEMRRVQTILVSTNPLSPHLLPDNITTPKIMQIVVDKRGLKKHQAAFGTDASQAGQLFLVDPKGDAMMLYTDQSNDPKWMLKDMKRLLKYSRLG